MLIDHQECYNHRMTKQAISVTLGEDNLTWLKGRVDAVGLRSVSELLDQLVSEARGGTRGPSRSVVGTIEIDSTDPNLDRADSYVRALFDASLARPLMAREVPDAPYGTPTKRSTKRSRG